MTFQVILEPGEDGWIVAECPALPGCISQGRTEAEAVDNIRSQGVGQGNSPQAHPAGRAYR